MFNDILAIENDINNDITDNIKILLISNIEINEPKRSSKEYSEIGSRGNKKDEGIKIKNS